ncbi:hypothetical protein PoB_002165100 [Plakobranchus ocellatus]|uniref:Uncharacterized protein n=1 Tax=Plakobranchus ocellatus TaxID=259542 RepID=A0AAV3ZGX3_9GAST|nr:hypothetical protein PoB_002165100 [Plakobranchus ocellatus]
MNGEWSYLRFDDRKSGASWHTHVNQVEISILAKMLTGPDHRLLVEQGRFAKPIHNTVTSGFQALVREPIAELEPATEGSLQISGRILYPLCHRRPQR